MIKLEQYLNFDDYGIDCGPKSPGLDDITDLIEVAKMIPKSPLDIGKVDPKILATLCLASFQRTNELYSRSILFYSLKKIELEAKFGSLIVEEDPNVKIPATLKKEAVKANKDYVKASEILSVAEAYVKFYAGLLKNFETGHYWARGQEATNNGELKLSSYEPHDNVYAERRAKASRKEVQPVNGEVADIDFN
jgi:hypothetical protein